MPQAENNKGVVKRKDSQGAAQKAGKNYLLVIGIDEYLLCPTLYNAVKDAKDIVAVLEDRFRFEKENITTLYNEQATKRKIYDAFRSFRRKITPKDNFIVYFSGHGEFDKDFGLGYWIPVKAAIGAVDEYIPNSEIRNILSSVPAHHTFLMVDSCFSGALFAKGASRAIALRKERDPSRWGLTVGRNEIVTDGQPGKNSPFAKSILYQLKNTDQPIGVAQLCDKVLEVVSANANQTPRGEPLKVEGHQGGQFVFHLKMDEVGDWNRTLTANTVAAYQAFLGKYPNSENAVTAKGKIKTFQAATLWQKIEGTRATKLNEVKNKLRLVNQYVKKYEDQAHYDDALNVGELLDYQKRYLQAKNSEFALRRFLRMDMPNVAGASDIKNAAQEKLSNWEDEEKVEEVITKKVEPIPIKKEIKGKSDVVLPPKPKPVKPVATEPSFIQKYGKYLPLLLIIPLMIYGISKAIKPKNNVSDTIAPIGIDTTLESSIEDPKIAALTQAQQDYNTFLAKGDAELRKTKPNYQIAKKDYENVIKAAKGFTIDIQSAESGVKKCDKEMANQNAAERDRQRKAKEAQIQKDYDQLITDGNRYYDKGDYETAMTKYQAAKGKVSNDAAARRGITKSQNKIDEAEKNRQAQLTAERERKNQENAWLSAKSKNTVAAYKAYQKKYPTGKYYKDATSQIKKLEQAIPTNANSGTFKDSRDGQTYKWVRLKDGKKWMAENLNYKTKDSWWYNDKSSNGSKYGRLYTWQAAKNACPKGWRLPKDNEWWKMASYYGKAYNSQDGQQINKEDNAGEAAYKALMQGGNSGFSALLGGYRDSGGSFNYLGYRGNYWSSTEESSSGAWYYSFDSRRKTLGRRIGDKSFGRSCRCLQD